MLKENQILRLKTEAYKAEKKPFWPENLKIIENWASWAQKIVFNVFEISSFQSIEPNVPYTEKMLYKLKTVANRHHCLPYYS